MKPIFIFLFSISIGILLLGLLVEGGLLLYGYIHADKVKCNLLWCEFTEQRRTIEQNSECYVNEIQVNCSTLNIPDIELP